MNMRNVHGMLVTHIDNVHIENSEHIKNIGISKFENTYRLLVQVRNLFINFELKVSTKGGETQSRYAVLFIWPQSRAAPMACKFVSPQRAPKVDRLRPVSSLNSLNFLSILHKPLRTSGAWRHSHSVTRFVSDYCNISE